MTKLEKFGLVSGIVGLLMDSIGLIGIIAGFWDVGNDGNTEVSKQETIYSIISLVLIIYGWVTIAWTLTRRSWLFRKKRNKKVFSRIVTNSVIGTGVLIAPLMLMWIWIVSVPVANAMVPSGVTSNSISTSQSLETSLSTVSPHNNLSEDTSKTEKKITAEDARVMNVVFGIPMLGGIIGLGIAVMMLLLMPLIYEDLSSAVDIVIT